MLRALDREIHAVTFDCWGTLLRFDREPEEARGRREGALARAVANAGLEVGRDEIAHLLAEAHRRHNDTWEAARATGSPEMARWALEPLGITDAAITKELIRDFQEAALANEVHALEGAVDTLRALAEREVGLALVCDTGFSPGRVVRLLLDRAGLLEWLQVQVFSDEAGLTKPRAPMFHAALDGLAARAEHTVHVGDLLRTDIAGARAVGMGTVRIRGFNDDPAALPEADAVADSHAHLCEILGV